MTNTDFSCRICQNTQGNQIHTAKEMMFGLRDEFEYVKCAGCGCLQLKEIPAEASRYYPSSYPGFYEPTKSRAEKSNNLLTRYLRQQRARYAMSGKSRIGRLAAKLRPIEEELVRFLKGVSRYGINFESRILDVGCGGGKLLWNLSRYGFRHLSGLDPYIQEGSSDSEGVRIFKREIFQETASYDLILFNHSFEHMDQPAQVLNAARRLLNPNGIIVLRMPTVSSLAWETYKTDWVQIDAPRHFFLYSLEALGILAQKAKLAIKDIVFDSTDFQFWASEQYQKDIPLLDEKSYYVNQDKAGFSPEQMRMFRAQARELNAQKRGDQICAYLAA